MINEYLVVPLSHLDGQLLDEIGVDVKELSACFMQAFYLFEFLYLGFGVIFHAFVAKLMNTV